MERCCRGGAAIVVGVSCENGQDKDRGRWRALLRVLYRVESSAIRGDGGLVRGRMKRGDRRMSEARRNSRLARSFYADALSVPVLRSR